VTLLNQSGSSWVSIESLRFRENEP
jgi:hypothetical protein